MSSSTALVDVEAAAVAVDRPSRTIYGWVRTGVLTVRGSDGRRALVDLADVQALAAARPARARRAGPRPCRGDDRPGRTCPNPAPDDAPVPLCDTHTHTLITWAARLPRVELD